MINTQFNVSRRRFLASAGVLGATSSLPSWFAQECAAQEATAPVKEDLRLALIGAGGRGTVLARDASKYGKIVAVCDVDANHVKRAQGLKQFAGAAGYEDFRTLLERKDVDAVICGTVDHWHTLVSMAAMKAGKDVYCEKPMTLTIDEGKRLVEVQKQTGRILQVGTQQRSDRYFRLACDLVRNGRVGTLKEVNVWLPAGLHNGPFKTTKVPDGFNYDFWLGQCPDVPYVKERTHFSFRYWWDYSGGTMTDWGAHHNDIALWALGMDDSGPISAEGKSLKDMIPGGYTAASQYDLKYTYANGVIHTCKSTTASAWHGGVIDKNRQQHGIKFVGADGWIWVTRDKIDASDRDMLSELPDSAPRVYHSSDHMANFIDCVKTRKQPICPVGVGHRSASMSHLGVLAVRLGRKINWDPVKEQFINDPEAQSYVARDMRGPYNYNMI